MLQSHTQQEQRQGAHKRHGRYSPPTTTARGDRSTREDGRGGARCGRIGGDGSGGVDEDEAADRSAELAGEGVDFYCTHTINTNPHISSETQSCAALCCAVLCCAVPTTNNEEEEEDLVERERFVT